MLCQIGQHRVDLDYLTNHPNYNLDNYDTYNNVYNHHCSCCGK
jgi:hypothetical protein